MHEPIVRQEIEIDAPAAAVWPFVATTEGLRQWWGSAIELEPQEGGRCAERAHLRGQEVFYQGRVTLYDPPRQLTLTLAPSPAADAAHAPGAMLARISITLEESAGRTRVRVVHQVLNWAAAVVPSPALPAVIPVPLGPQMRVGRATPKLPLGQVRPLPGVTALGLEQAWQRRLKMLQARLSASTTV